MMLNFSDIQIDMAPDVSKCQNVGTGYFAQGTSILQEKLSQTTAATIRSTHIAYVHMEAVFS